MEKPFTLTAEAAEIVPSLGDCLGIAGALILAGFVVLATTRLVLR